MERSFMKVTGFLMSQFFSYSQVVVYNQVVGCWVQVQVVVYIFSGCCGQQSCSGFL